MPDSQESGEIASLYEWLSLDRDVSRLGVLSLEPAASRSRTMDSGVDVIKVVLPNSIAAVSAAAAVMAAVARWRTSRPSAPVVQIESVTATVTLSDTDPEALRHLAARLSTGLPAPTHLSGVVRECLLWPPQPDSLYVVRPGTPEVRQVQKARATHPLEPGEELIAVWQWAKVMGMFSATPSSLIFTSHGIRIAEARLRLNVPYSAFHQHAFTYEYWPGGRTGPDVCQLVIDGPTPWRSPNADMTAELIADDLTRIKALAAGHD